ncbi:hypothetical protein [Streptomyces sp. NPDC005494]|uniref:hypothetical protein n=1 Tax=Streptomyces sp. NPDC005494 TaxID=3364715 RepID=UPI0036826E56
MTTVWYAHKVAFADAGQAGVQVWPVRPKPGNSAAGGRRRAIKRDLVLAALSRKAPPVPNKPPDVIALLRFVVRQIQSGKSLAGRDEAGAEWGATGHQAAKQA